MDWIQVILLSLIQGLTEFLPISSSAHLVLPAQLTDWPDQGLAFDVAVHLGTLLAAMAYFRQELLRMLAAFTHAPALLSNIGWRPTLLQSAAHGEHLDLIFKLTLATLPVVVVGFASKEIIETNLRTLSVIATTTILFAVVLWFSDRRPSHRALISWSDTVWIGLAQTLALIPGTSRSGITISVALLVGLNRVAAARFSFLLAIPTIAGAQLMLTRDLMSGENSVDLAHITAGGLIAFASAYFSIHFFIRLLDRFGLMPYVVYRLVLGSMLFWIIASA